MKIITTMNQSMYDLFGHKMVQSFQKYVPVELYIYNIDKVVLKEDVKTLNLASDNLEKIKKIYAGFKPMDYRFDILRFANKVFVVADMLKLETDKFFWVDADVIAYKPVPIELFDKWMPDDYETSCLQREGAYSECGFVGFNMKLLKKPFAAYWEQLYLTGAVQYLQQWHDCFTYDFTRKLTGAKTYNLSGEHADKEHPFVYSELGEYFDHLKGNRKSKGYSPEHPLKWWEAA